MFEWGRSLRNAAGHPLTQPACRLGVCSTFGFTLSPLQRSLIHDPLLPTELPVNTLPRSVHESLKELAVMQDLGSRLLSGAAPMGLLVAVSGCPSCSIPGVWAPLEPSGGTVKGPLTRKHNKRRRMKPITMKMPMRTIAQT